MCSMNIGCTCNDTGDKCPYVCSGCSRRLRGALGHGPACECPDPRLIATEVTQLRDLGISDEEILGREPSTKK